METGKIVRNIQPMRSKKECARMGSPAKIGDSGPVVATHRLKDTSLIIVFDTPNGWRYTHRQNLSQLEDN